MGKSEFNEIKYLLEELTRPSFLYRPKIIQKDNKEWLVFLGKYIDVGIVGTGKTPMEALKDFDNNWKEANE